MITRVAHDLAAQVVADAAASGRSAREEAENQHRVGLINDRALTAVYALADEHEREQRSRERQQEEDDARAAAPPPEARWNPNNGTWEVPTPTTGPDHAPDQPAPNQPAPNQPEPDQSEPEVDDEEPEL